MSAGNFEFKNVNSALAELNAALSDLEQIIKQNRQDNLIKDEKIKNLSSTAREVIENIDDIIEKMDKVVS